MTTDPVWGATVTAGAFDVLRRRWPDAAPTPDERQDLLRCLGSLSPDDRRALVDRALVELNTFPTPRDLARLLAAIRSEVGRRGLAAARAALDRRAS